MSTVTTVNEVVQGHEISRDMNSQKSFAEGMVALTSTPRPIPCNPPSRAQPTVRSRPVPKPRISTQSKNKKILLIGDSIVSGINPKGLKGNIYKHGIGGATIDVLLKEIEVYDLNQFSHIIVYVGGNNASNRTDIEYFEELYDQLLNYIKKSCQSKIVIVNSCPRRDTDTTDVNGIMQELSEHHEVELVNAHAAFFDKKGALIKRYYAKDGIHFSDSGVKRLLGAINRKVEIVDNFSSCVFHTPKRTVGNNRVSQRRQTHHHQNGKGLTTPCTKCGEKNHQTKDCKHAVQLKCLICGYYGHKTKKCENK